MSYLKQLKIQYVKIKAKNPLKKQIQNPEAIYKLFKDLEKEDKEKVISLHLNARQILTCFEVLSIGGIDLALVSAKDVFKGVLLTNSIGFILVHNHPSGDPTPSDQDQEIIKKLEKQAKIMEINFVDFLIIGDNKFWSWRFEKK